MVVRLLVMSLLMHWSLPGIGQAPVEHLSLINIKNGKEKLIKCERIVSVKERGGSTYDSLTFFEKQVLTEAGSISYDSLTEIRFKSPATNIISKVLLIGTGSLCGFMGLGVVAYSVQDGDSPMQGAWISVPFFLGSYWLIKQSFESRTRLLKTANYQIQLLAN